MQSLVQCVVLLLRCQLSRRGQGLAGIGMVVSWVKALTDIIIAGRRLQA